MMIDAVRKPTSCAIGLSVHTGWAACCLVSGDVRAPEVLARVGKGLGPPWGKDERMASLAASTALSTDLHPRSASSRG
jgi:hypothetical protein